MPGRGTLFPSNFIEVGGMVDFVVDVFEVRIVASSSSISERGEEGRTLSCGRITLGSDTVLGWETTTLNSGSGRETGREVDSDATGG